jgi:hypothetical protein
MSSSNAGIPWVRLLAITALGVAIHGYHLGADDAAIYVPGIKQAADPALYPFGAEFFQAHARWTIFQRLVGGSARLTHLPIDHVIFAWYVAGTFLLMVAAWRLMCACFDSAAARWSGIALLAGTLAVPVAGTALAIADPYLTSRTLSTPATVFAIASYISGRRRQTALWCLATALIHPQMAVYTLAFLASVALADRRASVAAVPAESGVVCMAGVPFLFEFGPAHGPAREALLSRTYFFVSQWSWYEWMGVAAPLALLSLASNTRLRNTRLPFRILARALIPFALLFTAGAVVLASARWLENYTRLQPMRSMHLVYIVFFLLLGGVIGEYVLRQRLWRWFALFVPLGGAMWLLGLSAYPASAHVEWPSGVGRNPWSAAFLWIRGNTPKDAVFALDPDYLARPGEDMHGFRAIAERSQLADELKDSGAVSLFPGLADEWKAEVRSLDGWDHFQLADFERVAKRYPVTWFVTQSPQAGLICPYRNSAVAVCRLLPATGRVFAAPMTGTARAPAFGSEDGLPDVATPVRPGAAAGQRELYRPQRSSFPSSR